MFSSSFLYFLVGMLIHKSTSLAFNSIRKAINHHNMTLILQLKIIFKATIFYNAFTVFLLSEDEVDKTKPSIAQETHRRLEL
jgi:hypothetical protein